MQSTRWPVREPVTKSTIIEEEWPRPTSLKTARCSMSSRTSRWMHPRYAVDVTWTGPRQVSRKVNFIAIRSQQRITRRNTTRTPVTNVIFLPNIQRRTVRVRFFPVFKNYTIRLFLDIHASIKQDEERNSRTGVLAILFRHAAKISGYTIGVND